ncbi:MAG TPA: hypothetical protein VFK68_11905 [Propionibacteriaceae bacterium]|nr:hypothetical protein [Propionibacteriaceae bacterium]
MSDDWGRKLSRFGNDLAAGLKDTGKLLKSDLEKARGYVAEQAQQGDAQRQAEQQRRWERASSPTWTAPAQAADTTEWATYELIDPRSQQVAVTFRHPADWQAGGQVMWPAGPGLPVTYAIGSSPADGSCVAERFPRTDLISGGLIATAEPGREVAPGGLMQDVIATTIVPRLRPGAFIVSIDAVDPALYVSQRVDPRLMGQGFLAWLEYDRAGVPWADELVVLRYQLPPTGGFVQEVRFGAAVWSLNARRDVFPSVRSTLRAIALSAASRSDWDAYASQQTGWPILI